MIDEKNNVVEETTEVTPASEETKEVDTEATEVNTEETNEETSEGDIDYQAELEAELKKKDERLNKAEHTIKKLKKDAKTSKDVDDDYTDAEPLGAKEIREIIREENQVFYNKTREADVKHKIGLNSTSPQEADLILYHLQNSIQITGDDDTDIRNARLLANAKRFDSEIKARDRAITSTQNAKAGAGAGHRIDKSEGSVKLTPDEEKLANATDPTGERGTAKRMLEAKKAELMSQ